RGAALKIWGEEVRSLDQFIGEGPIRLLGITIRGQIPVILVTLLAVATALGLFFGRTMTGKAMRACSYNRTAARLVGVNPGNMVMLSFAISASIAGLAGAVMVPITQAQYNAGPMLALKGFAAAVLGGLGNNGAALVAGLLLGVFEELASGVISSSYKDPIALGIMLVVLFFRPSGLFGRKELSKLSEF
ncbi:MAG: branched-chain amino acid ABC transporter permease, partial [Candidatus Sumerlaeota bacterium]